MTSVCGRNSGAPNKSWPGKSKNWGAPTRNWSSLPMWHPTTCRNPCAWSRPTRSFWRSAIAASSQLVQVFQNLIGNGIKFRGAQSPIITIQAEKKSESWEFAVTDNGIGISPEHREVIFVIFKRLHTHAEYPGTGLGLAICKKIIERHGGRIEVESKVGHGSTFLFTLPIRNMSEGI